VALYLEVPYGDQLSGILHDFQHYVIENIERYTGIMIEKVDIHVDRVSVPRFQADQGK